MPDFLMRLFFHQLVPLYLRSRHSSLRRLDDTTRMRLEQFSLGNTGQILSMFSRFRSVSQRLTEHGVRFAVYKGPALSQRVFKDIAVRQYGDIDLLIHPDDLFSAFELLLADGMKSSLPANAFIKAYLKHSRRDLTMGDTRLRLDIHQQIARGPRYYVLPDECWDRLDSMTMYRHTVPVLSVETELVILSVHAARHGWDHYKLVLDFAGLLRSPNLDWQRIDRLVRGFQARSMFDLAVSLCRSLFPDLAETVVPLSHKPSLSANLRHHLTVLDEARPYTDFSMLRQFFRLQDSSFNRLKMALFYLSYPRPEDPILLKFTRAGAVHLMPVIHPPWLLCRTMQKNKDRTTDQVDTE